MAPAVFVDSVSRPRAFEINIHNRLTTIDFITTLVHELIHVQQRVHREHVTKYNKNYWARKHVPSDTCYADQPWEQAAHFLEGQRYRASVTAPDMEEETEHNHTEWTVPRTVYTE